MIDNNVWGSMQLCCSKLQSCGKSDGAFVDTGNSK